MKVTILEMIIRYKKILSYSSLSLLLLLFIYLLPSFFVPSSPLPFHLSLVETQEESPLFGIDGKKISLFGKIKLSGWAFSPTSFDRRIKKIYLIDKDKKSLLAEASLDGHRRDVSQSFNLEESDNLGFELSSYIGLWKKNFPSLALVTYSEEKGYQELPLPKNFFKKHLRFNLWPLFYFPLILLFFLLPGFFLFFSFKEKFSFQKIDVPRDGFKILSLSVFFNILFYLSVDIIPSYLYGINLAESTFLLSYLFFLFFLFFFFWRKKLEISFEASSWPLVRNACLGFFILSFAASTWVSYDISVSPDGPFSSHHISSKKTMEVHVSHDNVFQFINAKIFKEHVHPDVYYGNKKLVYEFYHRPTLAALLFAPLWKMIETSQLLWVKDQFFYTMFGILLNGLVIFPLFFLLSFLTKEKNISLKQMLASVGAIFFVNMFFTWFKLAGGAFVLAGIYLLYKEKNSRSSWVWPSLFFGLASQMHPASIFALPPFLLFFLWGKKLKDVVFSLFLSGGIIALCNIPWSYVKKKFFVEDYLLIRQFFLNGMNLDSLSFSTFPWDWEKRVVQVADFFILSDIKRIFSNPHSFYEFHRYKLGTSALFMYELLIPLLLCFFLYFKFKTKESLAPLKLSSFLVFSILLTCFVSLASFPVNHSVAQPLASLVFIQAGMTHFIWHSSKKWAQIVWGWSVSSLVFLFIMIA